jgi:beta-lactamase class A
MQGQSLRRQVLEIADQAGARAVAVGIYDFRHRTGWSIDGERWFHAASTIKIAILVGVFAAIRDGRFLPHSRVHVRNRFLSAYEGTTYRIASARDANSAVHAAIGKTMSVEELAGHMIVTSSNLATNLLLDLVGIGSIRAVLDELGVQGVELNRGVEDEMAWEHGINNRVTANGLVALLRGLAAKEAVSEAAAERMLEILHEQQFRSGIPAGLPETARIAHKTGEISTVAHDAGVVYLEGREPYALAILTEWDVGEGSRHRTIAAIARTVHRHMTDGDDAGGADA